MDKAEIVKMVQKYMNKHKESIKSLLDNEGVCVYIPTIFHVYPMYIQCILHLYHVFI